MIHREDIDADAVEKMIKALQEQFGDIDDKPTDAIKILYRRYIKDDAERKASVQAEQVNAEVARVDEKIGEKDASQR